MATKNDVAHNWAHQLKSRLTSGNLSFEGCLIYSYRTAIGEVITLKDGTKIYVLNTGSYSNSTSKHQGYAFSAIPTDAIKFSASCDDFEIGWNGLTYYKGTFEDNKYCKGGCKTFVLKHLTKTFEILEGFATSKAVKNEEEFSLKWFDEAVRFCELTKTVTIKQMLKEKSSYMKTWWNIKNPAAFKKTMLAILSGERGLRVLVDMANGDGTWQEYFIRTNGVRASKEARKLNIMLGFAMNAGWNYYYQPYYYHYGDGGRNTCAKFPTNETYISRSMQGHVKGGFKASQIAKLRENGELVATLFDCKRKNFQLNCEYKDKELKLDRQKRAKEHLEMHLGFSGFYNHYYGGSRKKRTSFNYDGTVMVFNSWNSEESLGWDEYNSYTKMSLDEQKQFIHTKRLEMLARLQQENAENERIEREYSERQRIAREEREKVAKLYAEKKSYIEEMKAKGDTGVKQLWHEGLLGNNLYGKPNSFFNGGNALLRVSITGEQVESSKGIRVSITECKRLWAIINRWHTEHKEFDMDDYETIHATTSDWGIKRYQNDIMIAGCHAIAYSEMAAVAKQLGFC